MGRFLARRAFACRRGTRQIFGAVQMTISRITLVSAASSAEATAAGSLGGAATLAANNRPPTMRPLGPMIWARDFDDCLAPRRIEFEPPYAGLETEIRKHAGSANRAQTDARSESSR